MTTLEKTIEAYLVDQVENAGGLCLKWTGRKGVPDRILMLDGYTIPVEVKSPTGKLSEHQVRMHKKMFLAGITVEVISSKERVDELIDAIRYTGTCHCDACLELRTMN